MKKFINMFFGALFTIAFFSFVITVLTIAVIYLYSEFIKHI